MRTLLLLALGLAACASTDTQYLALQARAHDAALAPGDTVTITEAGTPLASGTVAMDGSLELPGVGLVQAAGLSRRELRTEIGLGSSVQIQTQAPGSGRVFVFGQVERSGRFPMSAAPTLMQLMEAAGPHPDFADLLHVRVLRGRGEALEEATFNVLQIMRGASDPVLLDGDIVVVDKSPLGQMAAPFQASREAPGRGASQTDASDQ